MDYAKRAAKLVQVDNIAGRWMPVLGGEYIVDPNGEHAGEQTERVRAWLAAELQAAHDAGEAEGKRGCSRELRTFIAMGHMVPENVAAFLQALPTRWEKTEPGAVEVAASGGSWTQITDDNATWPESGKDVIVSGDDEVFVAYIRIGEDFFRDGDGAPVTPPPQAWMPLPQAWKPEGGR